MILTRGKILVTVPWPNFLQKIPNFAVNRQFLAFHAFRADAVGWAAGRASGL